MWTSVREHKGLDFSVWTVGEAHKDFLCIVMGPIYVSEVMFFSLGGHLGAHA